MDIREAVISRIAGDAPTCALIDVFAAAPAIFSPVKPEGYDYGPVPAVLVRMPTILDDKTPFGHAAGAAKARSDVLLSVQVYMQFAKNSTSDKPMELAALSIRQLFRGRSFAGADGLTYQALVSGPTPAPVTSPQMTGATLQLRLNVGG